MDEHLENHGLSASEIPALRDKFGRNELPEPPKASPVRVFARQFTSFLVIILIIAAVIAFALGERIDTLAISLVVLLNGILGFIQEWRAENALEALRNMLSPKALVRRDGRQDQIDARDLVPGDVIVMAAGDRVPADARVLTAIQLRVDESILTGESLSVEKSLSDDLFTGTSVVDGRAEALVTKIGQDTEFGKIARLTGSVGNRQTHLQLQLAKLAKQLGLTSLGIAAMILGIGVWFGRDTVEMFMTGLSLAVAIVPEGLPAVVTITLALGAASMVKHRALARRLKAVETLGAASVICTDKTGTLTENKMTATKIWTPTNQYTVTGTGYDPAGYIALNGTRIRAQHDPDLARLLQVALTCTHARLRHDESGWTMTGEPTEAALVTLAYKGWAPIPSPDATLHETPFSSDRKRMSVLANSPQGRALFVKGAPEAILERCTLAAPERDKALQAYADLAQNGLRVIALAWRPEPEHNSRETDLIFLGLVGLIDPPRPEVKDAIRGARNAGIKIVMITGDSPVTANAIASQLGLHADTVLTGADLETLTDAQLHQKLQGNALFARTKPDHKMRIVAALQSAGQIVAMTGDGVNDAPALKQADIGISMGIRGTDVAKDASDLVLLDDNFATIVGAIAEGRRQYDNVRKFVRYLLSSNAGEVVAILTSIAIGGPLVFLATQILWMNLVTDGLTAVALGLEKSEPNQMKRAPRAKSEPILGFRGLLLIAVFGLYTGIASLWLFFTMLPAGETLARSTAFTAMVVFEKISVFAFRSLHAPCWKIGWFSNPLLLVALAVSFSAQLAALYWPPMQTLLHTVPIGKTEWLMIGALALPLLILPELIKTLRIWRMPQD